MHTFKFYTVSSLDVFNVENYPEIKDELTILSNRIRLTPGTGKVNAAISFLKDHCMNSAWVSANPVLADKIRSGQVGCMESLFESCRNNPKFLRDLERYISEGLHK